VKESAIAAGTLISHYQVTGTLGAGGRVLKTAAAAPTNPALVEWRLLS